MNDSSTADRIPSQTALFISRRLEPTNYILVRQLKTEDTAMANKRDTNGLKTETAPDAALLPGGAVVPSSNVGCGDGVAGGGTGVGALRIGPEAGQRKFISVSYESNLMAQY